MRRKTYVVYSRGLLRIEGRAEDGCDYVMNSGRPTFHSKMKNGDIVYIFVYNSAGLSERRDYYCLNTEHHQPLKAKKCVVTRF